MKESIGVCQPQKKYFSRGFSQQNNGGLVCVGGQYGSNMLQDQCTKVQSFHTYCSTVNMCMLGEEGYAVHTAVQ